MEGVLKVLPSLDDVDLPSLDFPERWTGFHIPQLLDKPQNPIMDALKAGVYDQHWHLPSDIRRPSTPNKIRSKKEDNEIPATPSLSKERDVWSRLPQERATSVSLHSWETLNPSRALSPSCTPFLSEQSSPRYSAVRYHVNPLLRDPLVYIKHITSSSLRTSLLATLIGTSSTLYVWNTASQAFQLRGINPGQRGIVLIDGKDEFVSDSVLSRFVGIGTSLRRLENFVEEIRRRQSDDPTLHAFAHAISSVLQYLVLSATDSSIDYDKGHLLALWAAFANHEDALKELCGLCGIGPSKPSVSLCATSLLSSIHERLSTCIEHSSSRVIVALLAFILGSASQPYFDRICESVALRSPRTKHRSTVDSMSDHLHQQLDEYTNADVEGSDDEEIDELHPTFLSKRLVQALRRARKSLALLRSAQSTHPLFQSSSGEDTIRWIWTEREILAAVDGGHETPPYQTELTATSLVQTPPLIPLYNEDLHEFSRFHHEPGTQTDSDVIVSEASRPSQFQLFLSSFPETLPSLIPTLPDLTNLVLSPLVHRIDSVSVALVEVFMSPTSHLHLHSNLVILRSYLLLTSHSFKSRLQTALFSDADDSVVHPHRDSSSVDKHSKTPKNSPPPPDRWAIGLSRKLMEDGWPPGGASLSFFLRTVIIDSLEYDHYHEFRTARETPESSNGARIKILREAEWRLGFAIRDLPTGNEAKWLNPRSIEALDFLYMEYQPPHPLDILIDPVILSKYHRIFAFNLRLLRVENAIHALYRMTRDIEHPLFPTLTKANKLFLHFQFVAQNFVTAISSYVYDIAIGSNFDAFLATISADRKDDPSGKMDFSEFSDVFSLAERHSAVLDVILGSCLLRSSQRAVGDLLRSSLEMVLDLALLMADLKQGTYQEYQASDSLEQLFHRFRSRVTMLCKVLAELVERGISIARPIEADTLTNPRPDLSDILSDLLLRLDISNWWRTTSKASSGK